MRSGESEEKQKTGRMGESSERLRGNDESSVRVVSKTAGQTKKTLEITSTHAPHSTGNTNICKKTQTKAQKCGHGDNSFNHHSVRFEVVWEELSKLQKTQTLPKPMGFFIWLSSSRSAVLQRSGVKAEFFTYVN